MLHLLWLVPGLPLLSFLALALIVAAPRLILVLPGLISTFLASRRHPRARWSTIKAA